jgi:hypothetical protein
MIARSYDPDHGWDGDQIVADGLKPPYLGCVDIDAHYHDVAIDPHGNAIAIWEERIDTEVGWRSEMGLWSSQYLVGHGWQPPLRVDAGDRQATVPLIALAAGSIGVAVYSLEAETAGVRTLATNQLAPAP